MKKGRVAVLLSGRGSNFEAIFKHSQNKGANYEVILVISNKKDAAGLDKAQKFNIQAHCLPPKQFSSKKEYEKEIVSLCNKNKIDLICLAGYMMIVGEELLTSYKNRIMNIHPALLPSFPGLYSQKQALDYGVKVSGCTVHFIDSGVDTGPIILQRTVDVHQGDNEESLSQRILTAEHQVFSRAIQLFFDGNLKIIDHRVIIQTG